MLLYHTFYSSNNPEQNISQFPQKYQAAQLILTLTILKMFLEQQINILQ